MVPSVVENPLPNSNNGNTGEGLVSALDSSTPSTSSAPSASYENDPTTSSRVTGFLSNGPVVADASANVTTVAPLQDSVDDGGSKFYGNLSFSDLVNGHHDDWRGDTARKRVELSPGKDAPLTSKLSAFGNTDSGSQSTEVLSKWGGNSSLSQVHGIKQSSSFSSGNLLGKSESTFSQDYSPENDIFGRLRGKIEALFSYVLATMPDDCLDYADLLTFVSSLCAATSKDSSQAGHSAYTSNQDYGSIFSSSKVADGLGHDANI